MNFNPVRASLVGFLAIASGCVFTVTMAINSFLYETPRMLRLEVQLLREESLAQIEMARIDLRTEIKKLNSNVDKHATALRTDLTSRIDQATYVLDARLADAEQMIDHIAHSYEATAVAIAEASLTHPLLMSSAEIAAQLAKQEPMIYSRYLATTGELNRTLDATRRTMEEVATATPALAENATIISANVAEVSKHIQVYTKPKGFWRLAVSVVLEALTFWR